MNRRRSDNNKSSLEPDTEEGRIRRLSLFHYVPYNGSGKVAKKCIEWTIERLPLVSDSKHIFVPQVEMIETSVNEKNAMIAHALHKIREPHSHSKTNEVNTYPRHHSHHKRIETSVIEKNAMIAHTLNKIRVPHSHSKTNEVNTQALQKVYSRHQWCHDKMIQVSSSDLLNRKGGRFNKTEMNKHPIPIDLYRQQIVSYNVPARQKQWSEDYTVKPSRRKDSFTSKNASRCLAAVDEDEIVSNSLLKEWSEDYTVTPSRRKDTKNASRYSSAVHKENTVSNNLLKKSASVHFIYTGNINSTHDMQNIPASSNEQSGSKCTVLTTLKPKDDISPPKFGDPNKKSDVQYFFLDKIDSQEDMLNNLKKDRKKKKARLIVEHYWV